MYEWLNRYEESYVDYAFLMKFLVFLLGLSVTYLFEKLKRQRNLEYANVETCLNYSNLRDHNQVRLQLLSFLS